jgi:hypothetical protein
LSHLSQVYTGFYLLHRREEILLSQECEKQDLFDPAKPQHLRDAKETHLLVIVNEKLKLYYDCHDSYEIDEPAAREVDYYFKRSYQPSSIAEPFKKKVFPLGLNYAVYPADFDAFEEERLATLGETRQPAFRFTVQPPPTFADDDLEPKALFITRVWDPLDNPKRSPEKNAERRQLNETRVSCVERLRQEFGNRLLGGLIHDDYAIENYKHALLPDNEMTEKENYLKLLPLYPVCITTNGLHGSIGWKMGEYVAFARAIAAEKLNYEVPGSFSHGRHYLEFKDPEQCVQQVGRLLSDSALRNAMMKNNAEYYANYLRPDSMIRRTLNIALGPYTKTQKAL